MESLVREVNFRINGRPVALSGLDPALSLNEWIREYRGLTGTKRMCGEGGCGCCVVYCEWLDPGHQGKKVKASVNSCLCPLYSVNNWDITTVEGIGNAVDGYHDIQKSVVENNASQCGYCTPGFVMSMYSLLQGKNVVSKEEIEDNFDGNICRCTGYRPILDAMKTFADEESRGVVDIEDLSSKKPCFSSCLGECGAQQKQCHSGLLWFGPVSVAQVFEVMKQCSNKNVQVICGGTGKGIFKNDAEPDVIVDLKGIVSLWRREVTDRSLVVGACVSLTQLIDVLRENKDKSSSFEELASHLQKVGNVAVRNCGSWAGNMMLKNKHGDFPSDLVTMMEAAGSTITIATTAEDTHTYSLTEFLTLTMHNKLIVSMEIPFLGKNERLKTFKVMPRAQNAHAYVNAGFRIECDPSSSAVTGTPAIVFGGIGEHEIHAKDTEMFIVGKIMTDQSTLQSALSVLEKELKPKHSPTAAAPSYRRSLACSLFYKFYLSCVCDVSPEVKSATAPLLRPVSIGRQDHDKPSPSLQPVTLSVPKLSALQLASGEAVFTTDIPHLPNELQAAFVLTSEGNASIVSVDPSRALDMPGVVAFVSAKDIPENGVNNFLSQSSFSHPEKVFATEESLYAGQALGIIIADTHMHAVRAVKNVKVEYKSLGVPVLSIKDAIERESFFPDPDPLMMGDEDIIQQAEHKVSGEVSCGTQYHFTMETQTSLVIPEEDGYTVHASTQWMQMAQSAVSLVLGIPASSVNVHVKRLGGGYGAKISRSHMVTAACALGAHVTRRPVRIHMDIDSNMKMIGKRYPYLVQYQAGFDGKGVICGIKMNIFNDSGCYNNEQEYEGGFLYSFIDAAYNIPNWILIGKSCKTNLPANTWCRAPASVQGTFVTETVLEHVANYLGGSYEEVRFKNFYNKGDMTPMFFPLDNCNIRELWQEMQSSAELESRQRAVDDFNKANRWKKRGIASVPIKFPVDWNNVAYSVLVSIYVEDGTVAIAHAGVEMGQGVNTKVAQAAASVLGIPLDYIKIKPSNTLTAPNSSFDGSSTTTELNVKAVMKACEELCSRIEPIRKKMGEDVKWVDLIRKCHSSRVDLSARAYVNELTEMLFQYMTYGVGCVEIELDVLTGRVELLRADVLYDCGQSMNPGLDIGQVEGAFVMGLGYWLTEDVKYDVKTGELLTHNTWEYKPPSSKDIPVDFRVSLLKNRPNPSGVLGSKAVGEPPQCVSCAAMFAVKRAIFSARKENGNEDYFTLSAPATTDVIQQKCLVNTEQFRL